MDRKGFISLVTVIIILVIGATLSGGVFYYVTKSQEEIKISAIPPSSESIDIELPSLQPSPSQVAGSSPIPTPPLPVAPQLKPSLIKNPLPLSPPPPTPLLLITPPPQPPASLPTPVIEPPASPAPTEIRWNFDDYTQTWKASGNPPPCPTPLKMQSPVDISLATAALYPGQYRGNDYKTHGGFRFDNSMNAVTVKAPMDAYIWRASRYIQSGEVQYLFFFISPCGIMYRFDHLLTLAPQLQKVADALPAAKPDDSRTTELSERITVKAGEIVATEIGFKNPKNVGVDFGVYDLHAPNLISQDSSWATIHENAKDSTFYAICFFDVLPDADESYLKTLPTGLEGKTSDYCK